MSDCKNCGRDDGHWLGCAQAAANAAELAAFDDSMVVTDHGVFPADCVKDGCENPRAVSKGPRPAKYCETHKTGSKKS